MAFDVTGAKVAKKLAAQRAGTCRVFVRLLPNTLQRHNATRHRVCLEAQLGHCFPLFKSGEPRKDQSACKLSAVLLNHQRNTEKSAPAKSTETVDCWFIVRATLRSLHAPLCVKQSPMHLFSGGFKHRGLRGSKSTREALDLVMICFFSSLSQQ